MNLTLPDPKLTEGTLYIVATPIGNLGDISLRALSILSSVDCIYAEDTRVTHKLLERYQIKTPLHSYREAAPRALVERTIASVITQLKAGKSLAYTSDAGTPGVSDPGDYLVRQVAASCLAVVPVPGPSALASILSVAGVGVQLPLFVGFLPKKKGRQTLLKHLAFELLEGVADGLVFYESPERVTKLLCDLLEWKQDLTVILGRELTKQFEEILRGSVAEVSSRLEGRTIKGECVILVTSNRL